MKLELNNGAGSSLDVVGLVLQAAVCIGDRDDLDDDFALGRRSAGLPVSPVSTLAAFRVASAGAPTSPTAVATAPG